MLSVQYPQSLTDEGQLVFGISNQLDTLYITSTANEIKYLWALVGNHCKINAHGGKWSQNI
jgi:hypothetical protein